MNYVSGDIIVASDDRVGYPTSIYHGNKHEIPFIVAVGTLMLVVYVSDDYAEAMVLTCKTLMWTIICETDFVVEKD